jgi:hypothetical protein
MFEVSEYLTNKNIGAYTQLTILQVPSIYTGYLKFHPVPFSHAPAAHNLSSGDAWSK